MNRNYRYMMITAGVLCILIGLLLIQLNVGPIANIPCGIGGLITGWNIGRLLRDI